MERDIEEALSRGVGEFIDPEGSFKEKLLKKARGEYDKDIIIKFGVDPTCPDIHLGHAVVFRRLRQFQEMGCKVIFLVGDFTAQIGDPTGKSKVRPEVDLKEVADNMKTFIDQVGKILRTDDPKLFSWIDNADWFTAVTDLALPKGSEVEIVPGTKVSGNSFLGKAKIFDDSRMQKKIGNNNVIGITLSTFLWTLKHITHSRLVARDMFQERIKKGEELYMHEMMYPVLQGIDSYAIASIYGSCDMEIGGTDQTFNMLVGRDVMKMSNLPEQAVLSMSILTGTDGVEKMSKSLDNYIAITDKPSEMFGKVMSIPDSVMGTYFALATYTPTDEVKDIESKISSGKLHPKEVKLRLAREITTIYHGETLAKEAEADFTETFSNKGVPEDMTTAKASVGTKIVDIVMAEKLVESKTEWRRLVEEKAVRWVEKDEVIEAPDKEVVEPMTLKIGKRRFIKIEVL
ncbi:MAG: tyrosine--tRNA ligase [Parcubacteria bacterium C7867-005]|nr:MAG: tyrosine--tRNA ligase [Parcubacteria bacterium C7867-005]